VQWNAIARPRHLEFHAVWAHVHPRLFRIESETDIVQTLKRSGQSATVHYFASRSCEPVIAALDRYKGIANTIVQLFWFRPFD